MYDAIKKEGFNVRGCVQAWCEDDKKAHKVYFDLVIFDDSNKALIIIECKNQLESFTQLKSGRQQRRYSKFGVPVIACSNMECVNEVLCQIKTITKRTM